MHGVSSNYNEKTKISCMDEEERQIVQYLKQMETQCPKNSIFAPILVINCDIFIT
ncbi:hypothetical protein A3Q56_05998 [Intoshia linei]|uniref:Uncharacterized protein n=1 Tax=Intoshia linei TaxID=1819745 RepID=A0A177AWC2_9BILA|nr:hypothetical protein A3Q56_05998 [Intoshia linei]